MLKYVYQLLKEFIMKKFKIVALLLALCLGLAMLVSCGGGGNPPCENHVDDDTNGECDLCGEPYCPEHTDVNGDDICDVCRQTIEKVSVEYTIVIKDEKGNGVPNIEITLNQYGEVKDTKTSDAQGEIKGQLDNAGKYTVIFAELPENWYSSANYSEITISPTRNTFEFDVIDNTPNGSAEKPFPSENANTGEAARVVFPAGQTYNFITKGAARYIVVNNANAKLIYEGNEYTPDENGIIKVLFKATESNSITMFQIVNTADTDNEIGLEFEAIKGSQQNPYDTTEGVEETVTVAPEQTIYYSYVATEDGVLKLNCQNPNNDIMLYNVTSYAQANSTNGASSAFIVVKEGDVVSISVSLVKDAPETEIEFYLTHATGKDTESAIIITENSTIRVGKGVTYYFSIEGEFVSASIISDVAVSVNGGEAGTSAIIDSDGFVVANSTDENAEIVISIVRE